MPRRLKEEIRLSDTLVESGAKNNMGELKQWQDKVLTLGHYIDNIVEQLDELLFHLKMVEEMSSC